MNRQDGYTLIELLVAMVIFSIGLLGMLSLTTSSMSVNTREDQSYTAAMLAEEKMEGLKNQGYSSLAAGNFTDATYPITLNNISLYRTWNITNITSPGLMRKVAVSVAIGSSSGRSVTLSTYIAK